MIDNEYIRGALAPLILLISINSYGEDYLSIEQSVVINAPVEEVCLFVSNPLNDYLWRDEVHKISSSSDITQEGNIYTEDAWIGLRKNFITVTKLIHYDCPNESLFETIEENPYFLRSHREFSQIDLTKTMFTYSVDFEKTMIKKVFGFKANAKMVSDLYSLRMRYYLLKLKFLLQK